MTMKTMKQTLLSALLAVGLLSAVTALAADASYDKQAPAFGTSAKAATTAQACRCLAPDAKN